jgi:hypothetical protein
MATTGNWSLKIETKIDGENWSISLTASEDGLLTMIRMMYGQFEERLLKAVNAPSGSRPMGMLEDFLVLNRCLVFNKFQEHNGKFVKILKA